MRQDASFEEMQCMKRCCEERLGTAAAHVAPFKGVFQVESPRGTVVLSTNIADGMIVDAHARACKNGMSMRRMGLTKC